VIIYVGRALSERSSIRIYIRLNGVLSTAELAALSRRSECAACGVAQLQGRRGDYHIERDPPDAGFARNADPDYKHQHEGGRRKKDKDLITQAKHRAAEYGDNCEREQQPCPQVKVLLFIFRYPCVFCGIDTSGRRIATDRPDRGALLALEIGTELRGIRPGVGYRPPALSGIKKPRTVSGSQARPVFVLWRRYASTRAPTYSLML